MSNEPQTSRDTPDPPGHLSERAATWWRSVISDWHLDPAERELLSMAAEALDIAREARESLDNKGIVYENSHGNLSKNPAAGIYHDAVQRYYRLIRELDFPEDRHGEITKLRNVDHA